MNNDKTLLRIMLDDCACPAFCSFYQEIVVDG